MLSAENTARLLALQRKVLAGEATHEELKEGIAILRQDRVAAQAASTTGRAKKAAEAKVVDPGSVLAELSALGKGLQSQVFPGSGS